MVNGAALSTPHAIRNLMSMFGIQTLIGPQNFWPVTKKAARPCFNVTFRADD